MVAGHAKSINEKKKNYEFIFFKFQHDDKRTSRQKEKKISVIK